MLSLAQTVSAQFLRSGGTGQDERRTSAVSDGSGGVFVSVTSDGGFFRYETSPGTLSSLSFTGNGGSAIIQYDASGNVVQALGFESTDYVDITDMVSDGAGGIWVIAQFDGNADIDPGPGTRNLVTSLPGTFIARYSSTGALGTVIQLPPNALGLGIAVDPTNGGPVVTGQFTQTVDLDPGAGVTNVTNRGDFAMFLARYTSSGTFISGFGITTSGTTPFPTRVTGSKGLVVDAAGTAYVAGVFRSNIDFDPGPGNGTRSASGLAQYVAAYSNSNALSWARTFNTGGSNTADDLEQDASGNLYLVGTFGQTINPPSGPITAAGASDAIVIQIDNTGVVGAVRTFGGNSTTNGDDRIRDIHVSPAGDILIAGQFAGTADFDFGPGTVSRTSPSGVSYVVAGYPAGMNTPTFATIKGTSTGDAAAWQVVPGQGNRIFVSGLFDETVDFNSAGGDSRTSIGALDFAVLGLENGAFLPVELTAFDALSDGSDVVLSWKTASETNNAGFAVEQKLDVAGERGASSEWTEVGFVEGAGTVESPRTYGFRVSDLPAGTHRFRLKQLDFDGAFEYSPIVEATVVPTDASLAVYPQPAVGSATVVVELPRRQRVEVQVYDLLGRVVETLHTGEAEGALRLDAGAGLPAGVYVVRAESETLSVSRQMVVAR
ncbi:MAG: T9SS type A sorting domain-containing protein [Bacteroidota bacterium]